MPEGDLYEWLVTSKFATWRRKCFGDDRPVHMALDFERCLREDRNIEAMRDAKCPVVEAYPKCSPDFNAIENVWHRIRQRMEEYAPEEMETRAQFLQRLRRTVNFLNDHCRDELMTLCTNQKERAEAVKKLKGAKSQW